MARLRQTIRRRRRGRRLIAVVLAALLGGFVLVGTELGLWPLDTDLLTGDGPAAEARMPPAPRPTPAQRRAAEVAAATAAAEGAGLPEPDLLPAPSTLDTPTAAPLVEPSTTATTPAVERAPSSEPTVPAAQVEAPARVETDHSSATDVDQLLDAARAGDAGAQFRLGEIYRDGIGVPTEPPRALAWMMQAAAREHAGATVERDRLWAALDQGEQVRAESLSRDLDVPFPAGWLRDPASGAAVWAPSYYRNGTWGIAIQAESVRDGRVHGAGTVALEAHLYGRSDRTHEGRFVDGVMLDPALDGVDVTLLATDEVRIPLERPIDAPASLVEIWMLNPLDGLAVTACPRRRPTVYASVDDAFARNDDSAVEAVARSALAAHAARCPLDSRGDVEVNVVPERHHAEVHRGDTVYRPLLAEVQLYGPDASPTNWQARVTNHARRAWEQAEREAQRQREKAERARKRAEQEAASLTRTLPLVRGLTIGMRLDEVREVLGADVADWSPPWDPNRELPAHASYRQAVRLTDGASLDLTFASAQNDSRLLVVVFEQRLRDGPDPDALRTQLRERYGAEDEASGSDTWLTWWLAGGTGEARSAFLRARIGVDARAGRVDYLRLVVNDYGLARRDEAQAIEAKRAAQRDQREREKSDAVKF
ncbi:MAG: SEL1-like repeat protein [Ectothiorhodospiraceae bacterium]|nr:SEL1-like repeat protein [Ectothiorhodospiraceae bacterium]